MESTGHYWIALYEYLGDQGYPAPVFNPLQIQAYRQVGIRKTKTDRVDSHFIAAFLRVRAAEAISVSARPIANCSNIDLPSPVKFVATSFKQATPAEK